MKTADKLTCLRSNEDGHNWKQLCCHYVDNQAVYTISSRIHGYWFGRTVYSDKVLAHAVYDHIELNEPIPQLPKGLQDDLADNDILANRAPLPPLPV